MQTQQIRQKFLRYFEQRGHAIIPSSTVVPHDDPTLLFINAGMNQFKDVFLGSSSREYIRAATSQKCIRVGGKHNDLENVGHTNRHLTFFEMLGNFSFGDYFKMEAIDFAWEVSTQVFDFDPERIWPTVFLDDDEAYDLWKRHLPAQRITRFGEKENFWTMGDVGPCGPCSELLYDRGPQYSTASCPAEDPNGERFLEFWNLVFMQYNRSTEGTLSPLPQPSVDTGAGLERVIALKMGVQSVFETDILRLLIARIEEIAGVSYNPSDEQLSPAFRVIADHLRCLSFAIADGVLPSNIDRGYVLRKVLRRAMRYGRRLGLEKPFLGQLLPTLLTAMGDDYRELILSRQQLIEIISSEEEAFLRTLRRGGNILNNVIESAHSHNKVISGDDAFKLKDTYGLPLEEILLLAQDDQLTVDLKRYHHLENEAKERSRNAQKATQQLASANQFGDYVEKNGESRFLGYTQHSTAATVLAIVVDGKFVDTLEENQEAMLLLDQTPFYAEMGGQVGDTGGIRGEKFLFEVTNTIVPSRGVIAHIGTLKSGVVTRNMAAVATVDEERRQKIANNHTATHLLHWALQKVLGEHIKQCGSVVDDYRLRFDFSHHKAISREELHRLEDLINSKIRENLQVKSYLLSYTEAQKQSDIKQFFGEKYGEKVRVIDIDCSKELCGGTHTEKLGNIGYFRIAKEGSIAAGTRRIEAITGVEAELFSRQTDDELNRLSGQLKCTANKIPERIEKIIDENKKLQLALKAAKQSAMKISISSLLNKVETIGQIPMLLAIVDVPADELASYADELASQLPLGIVIAAANNEGKCNIIARVGPDALSRGIKAGEIVKTMAPIIEGSGGGKPNSAQAGGKAPEKLSEAFAKARDLITAYLKND